MTFHFSSFFLRQDSPELDFLETREQFVPFRVEVILQRMLTDPRLDPNDRDSFCHFRRLLADRFHYEYRMVLESLKDDFVPFDPDRETLAEPEYSEEELQTIRLRLYVGIRNILQIGNYRELTSEQLAKCLELQPIGGLSVHVDTGDFEEFHVYYRGVRKNDETEPFLFFWKRTRLVTSLNRVFVLARFKQEYGGRVIIKMFKDVPVENIKIIAPKVKLGMPFFDRVKIGGSVVGSLLAPITKLLFAFTLSWIYFLVILAGLLIAAFKGIMSFLSSKTKYLHVFSSSLYYKNLSNNKAALTTLLDAAEDQEINETLLGYYILFVNKDREMTMEEIDQQTEQWIEEQFGHKLDFEVDDAIRKLLEKEIAFSSRPSPEISTSDSAEETYQVYDLPEVLRRLDETWDNFNSF